MKFGAGSNTNTKHLQSGGLCEYIEVEPYISVKFPSNRRKSPFKGSFQRNPLFINNPN